MYVYTKKFTMIKISIILLVLFFIIINKLLVYLMIHIFLQESR